ncbi:type IV secretory system conjugative DNA transfer family protein [Brachybacterium paraconglomeratum]|uniref:type IV secretory system conjugative DNA transfer family protein n=1 Tax=Brachybacterium paraconglomeratum TaxID=173362 RepID=UPI0022B076C7|nr:FtsK/SpoIIIE domain-containing protein [Brachybacterium paraconglomeratum]MCZ4326724.1 FtsK/SpoIIIE domain-containing protein [Brachybacterium paraconglomeratum]
MAVTKKRRPSTKKRNVEPSVDWSPWLAWGGLALGALLHLVHLPGGIVWWLAMLVAAMRARPPELTGKDDMGEPAPSTPRQEKLLRRYRSRRKSRRSLLGLSRSWVPTWPLPLGWVSAILVALTVSGLPMLSGIPRFVAIIEFIALVLTLTALLSMGRAVRSDPIDPIPRASVLDALRSLVQGPSGRQGTPPRLLTHPVGYRVGWVGAVLLGAAAGSAAWAIGRWLFPVIVQLPVVGFTPSAPPEPQTSSIPLWAATGAVSLLSLLVTRDARAAWRERGEARERWTKRISAKAPKLGVPDLIEHEVLSGGITVDTFQVPAAHSRDDYFRLAGSLKDAVGSTTDLYALPVLEDDGADGKVESRTQIRLVTWPDSARPDLTDGGVDDEVVALFVECVLSAVTDGDGTPAAAEVTRLSSSGSLRPAWTSEWAGGAGISPLRLGVGRIGNLLGVQALIDDQAGWLAFGALLDPDTEFDHEATGLDNDASMRQIFQDVADSDWWERVWTAALKGKEQQTPTYFPSQTATLSLPDGTEVHYSAFVTRQGLEPDLYFGREHALSTAIEDAPFVAIQPFPNAKASSADRAVSHSQAISVAYAKPQRVDEAGKTVPNRVPSTPQQVRPAAGPSGLRRGRSAQQVILSAHVAAAFRVAKLPVPLVTRVQALSSPRAPLHVWECLLQLDASPFADVQKKLPAIKQALGAPWVRIEPSPEGARLYAGANPTPELVPDRKTWQKTVDLDWGSTWITANIVGSDGATPQLVDAEPLPRNNDVIRATFELPPTLSVERIKGGKAKLRAARGLAFLEFKSDKATPTRLTILASEQDPVPFPAATDWEALAHPSESYALAFGLGYDGAPREFIPSRDISLLIQGMAGSGKSVAIQTVIAAAIAQGYLVAVIDPSKGGVDFAFADQWLMAPRAKEGEVALATLKALYAEVTSRKRLHDEHNVGHWRDLPEDVRRPPVLLVIDEFTSLVLPDALPPTSKEPAAQRARAAVESQNATRASIGGMVGRFLREARSVGVATLLGTQKLDASTLKLIPNAGDAKENASRMILGNPSIGALASALKRPYDAPDVGDEAPQGRGRFEPGTGPAELFQGYYATQPELRAFLESQEIPALEPTQLLDVAAYMPQVDATESEEDEESGLLILRGTPTAADTEIEDFDLSDLGIELEDLVSDETAPPAAADASDGPADTGPDETPTDDQFADFDLDRPQTAEPPEMNMFELELPPPSEEHNPAPAPSPARAATDEAPGGEADSWADNPFSDALPETADDPDRSAPGTQELEDSPFTPQEPPKTRRRPEGFSETSPFG